MPESAKVGTERPFKKGSLCSTDFREYEVILGSSSVNKQSARGDKDQPYQTGPSIATNSAGNDLSRRSRQVSVNQSRVTNLNFIEKNTKFDDKEIDSIQRHANELLTNSSVDQQLISSHVSEKRDENTPLTAAILKQTAETLAYAQHDNKIAATSMAQNVSMTPLF